MSSARGSRSPPSVLIHPAFERGHLGATTSFAWPRSCTPATIAGSVTGSVTVMATTRTSSILPRVRTDSETW